MHPRLQALASVLLLGALATACAEGSTPTDPTTLQPAFASGSGGGGGGGGGTGGGGGGGGVPVGKIRTASAAAVCDAGSSMGITIQKGFQNRAELVIGATASPIPTGPALPPSTFPQTSLGGWWDFSVTEDATGTSLVGLGTSSSLVGTSFQITTLGRTLTPGVHTFTFRGANRQQDGVIDYPTLIGLPVHESCTASITVVAN